jgi:hypothetical protein
LLHFDCDFDCDCGTGNFDFDFAFEILNPPVPGADRRAAIVVVCFENRAPRRIFLAVFDHTARAYNSITAGFIITFCGKPCCLSKQACFDIFLICPLTLDLPDVILTILFCAYNIVANSATTTTTLPRQLSRQRNVSVLPAAALFLLSFLSGIWVALLY